MGISERKVREKEELRQIIINAAIKIFVVEGYEKTSIRNIAESIEYSPGTIYLYFKDKDELLFAVHEVAFTRFFESMAPLLLIANPRERLLQMGHIYIQFAYDNPELYGLMFMDKAPMNCLETTEGGWVCGQQAHNLLRTTVEQCFENQQLTEVEIDVHTMSIWSFIHGLTSLGIRDRFCVLKEKGYQLDEMLKKSVESMLNMFLPQN
ncbi:MAG: TetR/AcrR family transcriptional regulator [Bacteroidota bacterium]